MVASRESTLSIEQLRLELERCQNELEAMRKRVAHAEAIVANVADAIFVCDIDGRITDANAAACEVLGYSKDELLGMELWNFIVRTPQEDIREFIQQVRLGAQSIFQRGYRHKNGDQRIMELCSTHCDVTGQALIVLCCRDITEQRALESRLRRSEKNLAEGQRLTKTGSWVLDFQTGTTDWSVETCRIFGFPDPPPSPHYSEFRERVHPDDRDSVDQGLRESFEVLESRPLEYRFILPDGTQKHIETISEPVVDDAGQVKLMGTVMDVTDRVKAEEALQRNEQCARAQSAALRRVLDELARESSSDRVVEHVLRTVTAQLDAVGSSVWLKESRHGYMVFEFALEDDQFKTKADPLLSTLEPMLRVTDVWPWPEVFRTGKPYVLGDIREGPDFPWRHRMLSMGVITILVVPLLIAGEVEGVIGIRFTEKRAFRIEELDLAQALAHQAMLAMQLRHFAVVDREAAVTAERTRMARDLHDTLAQGFTGVIVQLEAAEDAWSKGLSPEAGAHVTRARELARGSLHEARLSTRALRPAALMEQSLCKALDDMICKMTSGTSVKGSFTQKGTPWQLTNECEENLLRIGQEVLTNTLRHASARSFGACLIFEPQELRFEFQDDGVGFHSGAQHEGLGLIGIKERVESMGGTLTIESEEGKGTAILVRLGLSPLSSSATSVIVQ
ncbi:MAG TPA: PAS domain S-box protein [Polyangium sp.]|nr:PAS domain S-box protein [Polyangium sp.]